MTTKARELNIDELNQAALNGVTVWRKSARCQMSVQQKTEPVVLRWYPRSFGVLIDADLTCHTGRELLGWRKRGIDFVVLDDETGQDVTRIFIA